MSPEPTQEPVDNLNTANVNVNVITAHESDSEDEDAGPAGYMPLSQIPAEGEPLEDENDDDDEDFEWTHAPTEPQQSLPESNEPGEPSVDPETLEVWSAPGNSSNIDLDADKINQVKSAMASFTLPTTAIPDWANSISEDQWKEQLIHRIKEIQKDKK
ncbi:male-enhanced antigen 1 [Nasonia vitripennis]|uniref:Male-enhanced antigen 1 n=1 Tax=Nasonia vitripennis TaxID=7425 RepID=A0A7M7G4L1_NASVI|nr:male-enhanced antigen 1 [Nasonia vitripennis]